MMRYDDFQGLSLEKRMEKFLEGYAVWFCIPCGEPTLQKKSKHRGALVVWRCTECPSKQKRGGKDAQV